MPPPRSDEAKDQIRSRLNLIEVVQQYVRLRKQGRELWALCPFHQERTASFHVNEQKQSWYCFGCQKGGDMFDFVELIEKTDFRGALRILADMANVELPERRAGDHERSQLKRRLIELNRLASQYYEYVLHELPAGEPGRQHLLRREVGDETARRFGLGYAPAGSNLAAFLRKRGQSMGDAIAGGLVRHNGQDFFQDRLVVPIRDERGQPVAFTGRTVLDQELRKYVNTPETAAYTKGRVIFALDVAKAEIEARGHAVVMEGQFDVIMGHQFGVANALASSGTALTGDQITLLRRFTDELVLMFDNDRAGRAAAAKAIELAQEHQVRTRVARLKGEAKDPDEFLRGGGRWDDVLSEAKPGWEVLVVEEPRQGLNPHDPRDREVWLRRVRQQLGKIRDPVEQRTYAELAISGFEAGSRFGITPGQLLAFVPGPSRLERNANTGSERPPRDGLSPSQPGNKVSNRVGYLLQVLAVRPEALDRVRGILDPADLQEDDRAAFLRMVSVLEKGGLEALGQELDGFPAEDQRLVRKAWAEPPPTLSDAVVDDLVRRIKDMARRRRMLAIADRLTEAERRQDRAQIELLEAQLSELRERI